jgi:hypothetical protein
VKNDIKTQELYLSYRKGWLDGAQARVKDEKHIKHLTRPDLTNAYERGYTNGFLARSEALQKEADRLGYDMTTAILRELIEGNSEDGSG